MASLNCVYVYFSLCMQKLLCAYQIDHKVRQLEPTYKIALAMCFCLCLEEFKEKFSREYN